VESFSPFATKEDFYLYCGQLVPYKRADIAVEAFNRLNKPLVVIGEGSEMRRLKAMAKANIRFLGWQPDGELRRHYASCRALIFPGVEDFGIVPVEAMASGSPVIGLDRGGIRDTVRDGVSGILYPDQSVEGLMEAINRFESLERSFVPSDILAQAARFSGSRFRSEIADLVERKMAEFRKNGPFLD
jgi:glycosyltransferase involved in cell wall biosynthesis